MIVVFMETKIPLNLGKCEKHSHSKLIESGMWTHTAPFYFQMKILVCLFSQGQENSAEKKNGLRNRICGNPMYRRKIRPNLWM